MYTQYNMKKFPSLEFFYTHAVTGVTDKYEVWREETRHTQYKRQDKRHTRDKTRQNKREEPPNVRRHGIPYSNLLWLDQG